MKDEQVQSEGKEVHFTNVGSSVNDDGVTIYSFDSAVIVDGVETGSQKGQTIEVTEDEPVEVTFRKLADDTHKVFVNGDAIGYGALDSGVGMTPAQLEHSASTPEADADIVPEA